MNAEFEPVTLHDPTREEFIEELTALLSEVEAKQEPSNVQLFEAVFAVLRKQSQNSSR